MSRIRMVHLSDIHFGQEDKDGTFHHQEDVRNAVTRDCKVMRGKLGPANGILVTGDIAYAGKKAEYDRAGVWLDNICDIVGCERRAVHIIPGNHDVDRSKIDYGVELLHKDLRKCSPDDVDSILAKILGNDPKGLSSSAVSFFEKLAAYREFSNRYESDFQSERRPVCIKEIKFPTGHILRFFGMTSVQVCDANDAKGTMILGSSQYIFKQEDNVEYVVMCHHPLPWFKDEANAQPRIITRGRVLLAGHEHQPRFRKVMEGNTEYLMLDAGATTPPGSEQRSPFCYNWIEFDLSEANDNFSLGVSVFPRKWIHGKAEFDTDRERTDGAESLRFSVPCRNYTKIAEAPAAETVSVTPVGVNEEEIAAMPDEERFARLLYFFWRYLDWRQRYAVLTKVDVLPKGLERPMPQLVERSALSTARDRNKLAEVWDEVMAYVPAAERQQNPF
ncbi:metallophosphoesterase [Bradyrhizobium sp. BWA-3-5]|uniref:metallophosphoesterase n=1 Tax=Bradyrhizobium sp. BWA-3-5 TaxID=3080013 RepID=UPI00293EC573|nr:metallophosphoesterase [Bradyrhizobium sp. BWA-3-5]WOH68866.1 metallophosphoesterase [Bradyrhizobium sp. BWA-3-5]